MADAKIVDELDDIIHGAPVVALLKFVAKYGDRSQQRRGGVLQNIQHQGSTFVRELNKFCQRVPNSQYLKRRLEP
jgi:hypothetical protein